MGLQLVLYMEWLQVLVGGNPLGVVQMGMVFGVIWYMSCRSYGTGL